jgi:hypothetical protein
MKVLNVKVGFATRPSEASVLCMASVIHGSTAVEMCLDLRYSNKGNAGVSDGCRDQNVQVSTGETSVWLVPYMYNNISKV